MRSRNCTTSDPDIVGFKSVDCSAVLGLEEPHKMVRFVHGQDLTTEQVRKDDFKCRVTEGDDLKDHRKLVPQKEVTRPEKIPTSLFLIHLVDPRNESAHNESAHISMFPKFQNIQSLTANIHNNLHPITTSINENESNHHHDSVLQVDLLRDI